MRVGQANLSENVNHPPLCMFREGARTLNEKITAFVLAALAAVASFFLLPANAAAVLTGVIGVLFSALCCLDGEEVSPDQRRWYHSVAYAIPNALSHVFVQSQPPQLPSAVGHMLVQPQELPSTVSHVLVQGQVQPVLNPGPRMVAGTGQIQNSIQPQLPNTVSHLLVQGQVQPVLNPGTRMLAGIGQTQIAAHRIQAAPWRYPPSSPDRQNPNLTPQFNHVDHQPRAPVGRQNI